MEHQWVPQRPAEARQFGSWTRGYLVAEAAEWSGGPFIYLPGVNTLFLCVMWLVRLSAITAGRGSEV